VLVECTVVNEDSVREIQLRSADTVVCHVDDVGAVRFASRAKGERKLAGWVDTAVENICNGVARLLARNTCPDDGCDIRVVVVLLKEDWTHGMEHKDGLVTECRNVLNKSIAVVPKCQIVAVTLISVHGDVALSRVRVCKHDADAVDFTSALGQELNLRIVIVVKDGLDRRSAGGEYLVLNGGLWGNKVWEVGGSGTPAHGQCTIVASAVAASVGTVEVGACIFAKDSSELLLSSKGQGSIVLEEDSATSGRIADVSSGVWSSRIDMQVHDSIPFHRCVMLISVRELSPCWFVVSWVRECGERFL